MTKEAQSNMPQVPHAIVQRLGASLTWRGVCQWYTSPNRYLDGKRPMDVPCERALEAACAFDEGAYL